jgi:hypothetical protein
MRAFAVRVLARSVWEQDRQAQRNGVQTPHALEQKYPKVGSTWGWFWLFPSPTLSIDPVSGVERRHHLFEERLQRAVKKWRWCRQAARQVRWIHWPLAADWRLNGGLGRCSSMTL